MNDIFHVTATGLEAERQALANGQKIKITHVVVDSVNRPIDTDYTTLTSITPPNDQNGTPAKYPVHGESQNDKLLVAWTLPADSGGYTVTGLGFVIEGGILWAYQPVTIGYKPNPDLGGAFFEPKGLLTHETSTASAITCSLKLDDAYATLDQVRLLIDANRLHMQRMVRRVEGKLGKVRLFMANDVDEDYLPIRGQILKRTDYPDYFDYMGVTSSTLTLPDWGRNGYIRQFNNSLKAGVTLSDSIKAHNHQATSMDAGKHYPKAKAYTMGRKTLDAFSLSGRFGSDYPGNHQHESGWGENNTNWAPFGTGARGRFGSSSTDRDNYSWYTSGAGNHNHYTHVLFNNIKPTVNIGSFTVSMYEVPDHQHKISIENTGGEETRPQTTVAVYAVKVKWVTGLN